MAAAAARTISPISEASSQFGRFFSVSTTASVGVTPGDRSTGAGPGCAAPEARSYTAITLSCFRPRYRA
jgi:hypothetical protein